MDVKDAILVTINSASEDGITGRTLLQKKLYFLSVLAGEDFGFHPHFYGPYSPLVSDEIGALVEAGFIEEQVDVFPGVIGRFGERRRFTYRLTDAGKEILHGVVGRSQGYENSLGVVNGHALSNNPNLLPIAAKVHFILKEHERASVDEIKQRAQELGWKLNEEEISQVAEYLKHLNVATED